MKTKSIKDYNKKYNSIPNNSHSRFKYLINELNLKESDIDNLKRSINKFEKISFKTLSFIFYFIPQATPRPRHSGFSKVFYVKNILNYNEIFGEFINKCDEIGFKITTPCRLIIKTYSPMPESMSKVEKVMAELEMIKNISRPDWDNLGKTYSDMIQKHLIIDDSLIFDGTVQKFYSIKPRIEIVIEYMEDYDSNYNKNKIKKWKSYNE